MIRLITIVLTYRNRDLNIVLKCLASIKNQSNQSFEVVIVNYGSSQYFSEGINVLVKKFQFVRIINCAVQNQLWCKSRAINIGLKQCNTPYFFVADIDMIYHPRFIEKLHLLKGKADAIYFQVGFLSQTESKKDKAFEEFEINFKSTYEATGMTLYKTEVLKSINGYDEYYHGWGSEDTDVHVRIKNANKSVLYFDNEVLILHQWHPKTYRSKLSLEPFHSNLEAINHKYLKYTKTNGNIIANHNRNWGTYDPESYDHFTSIDLEVELTNDLSDVKGFMNNLLSNLGNKVVSVSIVKHHEYNSIRHLIKKLINKKVQTFLTMEEVNNLLLECLILNYRNLPYKYCFDSSSNKISLIIKL